MAEKELIAITQSILNSVLENDYATYAKYTDASVTCFEPEALGHQVHGLDFHRFYFSIPRTESVPVPPRTTLSEPFVRLIGTDAAVVSYVRLNQKVADGRPITTRYNETRVFEKRASGWICVHFHRSTA